MPGSTLVLLYAIGLFLGAMFITTVLIEPTEDDDIGESIMVSVMGYVLYWIVLSVTGFTKRLLPTIICVMACGSILTILMVAAFVLLNPFVGNNFAALIAWLILAWSVPVKGHIIARAIEQHWYIGVTIALTIFIMQQLALNAMTVNPGA